jgi:diguanylate cyclase (GGDEF)-like protein
MAAAWTRAFFSRPSRVAATLEFTGAIAIASVLPLRHWARATLVVLVVAIAVAVILAGVRLAVGSRLPRWSLQIDVGLGTLLVSVVTAASAKEHVGLANLYLLIALFAILYLPLRSALAHILVAGAAYAVVLGFEPAPGASPGAAWLTVFGTMAVLGLVVLGLVSVLRVAAREDPLTGLANRRVWDERLEEELERSRRTGVALSVVMSDLDGFKEMNDAGGHDAGDHLLQELARAWLATVRGGGDFLARLGGDEFGVVAPGSDEAGIRRLAGRLEDALPEGTSASIGVATWDGTENASDLLRRADRAMYQAKRRRRRGDHPV